MAGCANARDRHVPGSRPIAPATTRRRTRVRTGCHRGVSKTPTTRAPRSKSPPPVVQSTPSTRWSTASALPSTPWERWKENYATQSGKTECPNAMWRKRPHAQLARQCTRRRRCAKAWPEIGSEPTAEEMEGKEIIINEIPGNQPQQTSQRRAAPWMPSAARAPNRSPGARSGGRTRPGGPRQRLRRPLRRHRGASDTAEWQQAYTTAWTWASENRRQGDRERYQSRSPASARNSSSAQQ